MKMKVMFAALVVAIAVIEHKYVGWTAGRHRWTIIDLPASLYGKYLANAEGLWLYWKRWLCVGNSRGAVVVVHGFGEHCGRAAYDKLALALNGMGLDVYAMDHQGHGRSGGERVHVEDFVCLIRDLRKFVRERVRPDREARGVGNTPLFILGHSMGGLIAARALQSSGGTDYKAAVFSAPAWSTDPQLATPAKVAMGSVLQRFFPRMPLGQLEVKAISREKMVVAEYTQDVLNHHGPIPARLGIGMIMTQKAVMAQASAVKIPFLVVHGQNDAICPIQGSTDFIAKAGTPHQNKHLKSYPGAFHELFEEEQGQRVLRDIVEFLRKYI
eukprot:TRINITY_DN47195_c0_g1_i1.p1 TRINITY_DN47195_c0_g1~~TRINITY_DN47195_c0_g1_i1.p1  ORF type:complete len:327 (+),score=97.45 TRINITY_DN47195_c0_g1_i1:96-1076(+)